MLCARGIVNPRAHAWVVSPVHSAAQDAQDRALREEMRAKQMEEYRVRCRLPWGRHCGLSAAGAMARQAEQQQRMDALKSSGVFGTEQVGPVIWRATQLVSLPPLSSLPPPQHTCLLACPCLPLFIRRCCLCHLDPLSRPLRRTSIIRALHPLVAALPRAGPADLQVVPAHRMLPAGRQVRTRA